MAKATQRRNNIRVELARLQIMELDELRKKWRDLYGKEPPDCGKILLRRQLAFRIQETLLSAAVQCLPALLEGIPGRKGLCGAHLGVCERRTESG